MSLKLTNDDLDTAIEDGYHEAKLQKVEMVEKKIKGYNREVIKFVFRVKSKLIFEECIKYLHPEDDSRLKSFLEGMIGKGIEEILEESLDLNELIGNKYEVEIRKNKSRKTGRVFYNIDRITGKVHGNDEEDEFAYMF